jgi:hypothetical protein
MSELINRVSAASRYGELLTLRESYLYRGRECSKYTIPSLVPPTDSPNHGPFYTPYQSVGARGVRNLAAKLVMALLPTNSAFFRYVLADKITNRLDSVTREKWEKALSLMEQRVLREIERRGLRTHANEAFKHLVVSGNVLIYFPKESDTIRVFPLSQYTVMRDGEGNLLEIVVKEKVAPSTLPESVRSQAREHCTKHNYKEIELYTWIKRENDGSFTVHQECCDLIIPDSVGRYIKNRVPWLALRWTRIDGEDYGRGLCEEVFGDLTSLEKLSQAIVEGSGAAARILFLVDPNGSTDPKDLEGAPNLAVRMGRKDDVTVAGVDKFADFSIAKQTADGLELRLNRAFLDSGSVQRQAERVTAEEIRYLAAELENALGGVYSVLSSEFQLPLVELVTASLEGTEFPRLNKELVYPTIITGLDALGRSQELMRLDYFVGGAAQNIGPAVYDRLNLSSYLSRRASALGIDDEGLILTEEQYQQKIQAAQQAALVEKAAPAAVKAMSDQALAAQQGSKANV